jgi:uncharacterized protein (TIGR00255 family)
MIASMTGFGEGRADVDGVEASVEIRSVNKRHCDVSVRLPGNLAARETEIEKRIKQAFERGRFTVNVQVDETDDAVLPIEVDDEAAARYRELLDDLRAAADLDEPVRLDHLLEFSDVFTTREADPEDTEEAWIATQRALDEAIEALRLMRRDEGEALRTDLEQRIDTIATHVEAVQERAPERVEQEQDKLRARIDELVESDAVDEGRLETEIAVLADKLDITEECVRLHSHLEQFRAALADSEPAGRKLKFITQEIHREANTIGSKANDATISQHAVEMKEAIEQIREQIRNVE